jgi:uncharacterized protein YggE
MVQSKVAEKEALKADVAKAQAKAEAMATTMMFMGVDTSLVGMDTASISNMMRLNGIK